MASISKHFRISEEAFTKIRDRDRDRFPLERDFINQALISFGEQSKLDEILKELREIRTWMEEKTGPVRWK